MMWSSRNSFQNWNDYLSLGKSSFGKQHDALESCSSTKQEAQEACPRKIGQHGSYGA